MATAIISLMVPSFLSLVISLAAATFLAFGIFQMKQLATKQGLDGVSGTLVYLLLEGFLGGITGIAITALGGAFAEFPGSTIALGLLAGVLAATGTLLLNIAVTTGSMSSSYALANLYPIGQLFFVPISGALIPVIVLAVTTTGILYGFNATKKEKYANFMQDLYYERMHEEKEKAKKETSKPAKPAAPQDLEENKSFIEKTLLKTI